jgi:hypothetical protein
MRPLCAKMAQKAVDSHIDENDGQPPTRSSYAQALDMPAAEGGEVIMLPLALTHGMKTKITLEVPRSLVVRIDRLAEENGTTREEFLQGVLARCHL